MLINFIKEGDVYRGICTCGEVFYVYNPDDNLRCKDCLVKNAEAKKAKSICIDILKNIKKIIFNICKKDNYGR